MRVRYQQWSVPITILTITFLYLGVRLLDLDRLVTTDEPFWLGRSGNFYRALVTGELEYTYQMAHPGVMTMWAGSFAYLIHFPEYAELAEGNMQVPYAIEQHLRNFGQNPLDLMVAAKVAKLVMQTMFFTLSLVLLSRLVSMEVVLLAGLLLSFSPILTGFDSALHVDGLFTAITMAATAAVCWASFPPRNQPRLAA